VTQLGRRGNNFLELFGVGLTSLSFKYSSC
jgi:hypothetical protein